MDLQALRYAALVSTLTFKGAVDAFSRFLHKQKSNDDQENGDVNDITEFSNKVDEDKEDEIAKTMLLGHLNWDVPDESQFAQSVRIFLISADFSQELTTSVLWLNEQGLDIQCHRVQPYVLNEGKPNEQRLMSIQQVIPLPETSEYQIRVSEQSRKRREFQSGKRDNTRYDLRICGNDVIENESKSRVISKVINYLAQKGYDINEIANCCNTGPKSFSISVEGMIKDVNEFKSQALEQHEIQEKFSKDNWYLNRFYTSDEDLIFSGGRTYAFTNQWRNPKFWKEAMNELQSTYRDDKIQYRPHGNAQWITNDDEGLDSNHNEEQTE